MTTVGLRPSPGLRWVTDDRTVTIATADGSRTHVLRGTEAVVWQWMSSCAAQPRLVEFVAQLEGTDTQAAADNLTSLLTRWCDAGLLEAAPGPGARHG